MVMELVLNNRDLEGKAFLKTLAGVLPSGSSIKHGGKMYFCEGNLWVCGGRAFNFEELCARILKGVHQVTVEWNEEN